MTDATPEPDRAEGAPHPRETQTLAGHAAAQAAFLEAVAAGRVHHAWLLTGPPGVGKATLAWQIARFLLAEDAAAPGLPGAPPPATLETDPQSPRNRRITALSEPALFLLRRGWDDKARRLRQVITVEEVRRLRASFGMSLPDGGRRVVIVDAADEMNASAANALLKLLEEPPAGTVFLLVAHAPSRLLPTIRSRCRRLVCAPLAEAEVDRALAALDPDLDAAARARLARLSEGSVGAAWRLHALDGLALQDAIDRLVEAMPGADRGEAHRLAATLAERGAEDRRALFLQLWDATLARLARAGAGAEAGGAARLAPSPAAARLWAETLTREGARVRQGLAVNLDPHALILDMLLRTDRTAAQAAALE